MSNTPFLHSWLPYNFALIILMLRRYYIRYEIILAGMTLRAYNHFANRKFKLFHWAAVQRDGRGSSVEIPTSTIFRALTLQPATGYRTESFDRVLWTAAHLAGIGRAHWF